MVVSTCTIYGANFSCFSRVEHSQKYYSGGPRIFDGHAMCNAKNFASLMFSQSKMQPRNYVPL